MHWTGNAVDVQVGKGGWSSVQGVQMMRFAAGRTVQREKQMTDQTY